ncbi:hypothetical protein [Alishewanella longhuensis]
MHLVKNHIVSAVLFFCFASLMLGYELGMGIAQGWRFNGLLIIATCCFLYGCRLLASGFKQTALLSQ